MFRAVWCCFFIPIQPDSFPCSWGDKYTIFLVLGGKKSVWFYKLVLKKSVKIYTQANPSASLVILLLLLLLLAIDEFVFAERQSRETKLKLNIYEIFAIKCLIMIKRNTTSCKPHDKHKVSVCPHVSVTLWYPGCPFSPPLLAFVSRRPFMSLLFTCPRPWVAPSLHPLLSSHLLLHYITRPVSVPQPIFLLTHPDLSMSPPPFSPSCCSCCPSSLYLIHLLALLTLGLYSSPPSSQLLLICWSPCLSG